MTEKAENQSLGSASLNACFGLRHSTLRQLERDRGLIARQFVRDLIEFCLARDERVAVARGRLRRLAIQKCLLDAYQLKARKKIRQDDGC